MISADSAIKCPRLAELPPPPAGKTGWPWTFETPPITGTPSSGCEWPKISIITASRNHGDFLEETIRSVLLQGYPNLEYIIMDGASEDNSVAIIQKYDPWISYWISKPDGGPGHAASEALKMATGKLFGLKCADDYYLPGALRTLVELSIAKPKAVGWAGACRVIDQFDRVIHESIPHACESSAVGDWCEENLFCSGACLFSAELYRSVGGLDERFNLSGDDGDLWIKLSKHGPFALTSKFVETIRSVPGSVVNRDRAMDLIACISSNYINGFRGTARKVFLRYGEQQALAALAAADAEKVVCAMGRRRVISAALRSFVGDFARRVGIFRKHSRRAE